MTTIDPDELSREIADAGTRVEALLVELLAAHPGLQKNLVVAGVFVGHGLASLVANGLTDDQIVTHVFTLIGEIRKAQGAVDDVQDSDASVH